MRDKNRKIRVALIYDLPDWVLGEIAFSLEENLNKRSEILEVTSYQSPQKYFDLLTIELQNDIIHFLSPWDYYKYFQAVIKPSVVTIHHLVTFEQFEGTKDGASAICTQSRQWFTRLKKELLPNTDRIFLTPPLINCDVFKPISAAREELISHLNCAPDTILLGFAAKKSSDESGRKGLDRLFKLVVTLKNQNISFLLLIFGKGWQQDDFPEDLKYNIKLLGFVNARELPFYFAGLDYYLCLSRIEGGPYPVLECMAAGVKVISTPVGIVPEIISHEVNGFVVNGDNYLRLIPDILSKWSDDNAQSRLLKTNARTSVLEQFSLNKTASPEIFEPVYQFALKDTPVHPIYERARLLVRLFYRLLRRFI